MSKRNRHGLLWQTDHYWQSSSYNQQLYLALRTQILNIALTRYHWVNLPDTCDPRYLERELLFNGFGTIAKHDGVWRSLKLAGWQKAPDMYGNPTMWTALGDNGYQFPVTAANGMYVWDNHIRMPVLPRLDIWCRELVDIIRTLQQNRAHLKVPVIISGIQDKKLDMTNYVKQVAGGEAFIITTNGIDALDVKALKTDMPSHQEELWASYLNVWNQIYSALGVGNLPFKAERQIADEVRSQTDPTDLTALDGLTERRRACQLLNNRFPEFADKPLDVVWRADNATDNYNILHNLGKLLAAEDGDTDDADQ